MSDLFTVLFVHRYRDSDPAIRGMAIQFLGECVETCPIYFLDSQYLRYKISIDDSSLLTLYLDIWDGFSLIKVSWFVVRVSLPS